MLLNEEMSIQQMINKNPLKNFIYFEGTLPYKIDINTDFYVFKINIDIRGNYNNQIESRKVLFTSSQHWIEGQKMPSIKSVLSFRFPDKTYTNVISKFKLCVEVFDDEISLLEKIDSFNDLELIVNDFYQSILLFISSKYNQSLLGKDCINISIEDCGAGIIFVYQLEGREYKMLHDIIFPSYKVKKSFKHKIFEFKKVLVSDDIIWLYYYNMAVYSYDRREYLNSVIYSSISLESYLNYLIRNAFLENEFQTYNEELKELEKVPGFFTTLKFLKDNKVIKQKCWKEIKSCYGDLSKNRNDIIHGNIEAILLNSNISENSLNKIGKIYETYESAFVKPIE